MIFTVTVVFKLVFCLLMIVNVLLPGTLVGKLSLSGTRLNVNEYVASSVLVELYVIQFSPDIEAPPGQVPEMVTDGTL